MPCLLIHDCLMGVPEHHQLVLPGFPALLRLIGLADGLAQHRVPHVLPFPRDMGNGGARPAIRVMEPVAVVILRAVFLCVGGRYGNPVGAQGVRDLVDPLPLHHQAEDAPNHRSRFRVYDQVVLVLRVTQVAVGDAGGDPLPLLHPGPEHGLYLAAGVPGIPLVHDVQKRGEVAVLLAAVYPVVDGDEADPLFLEHDLGVEPHLQVVPPEPAHVLHDDHGHVPGLHLGNHGLEPLPVKGGPAHAVVREVAHVGKAVLPRVVLQ